MATKKKSSKKNTVKATKKSVGIENEFISVISVALGIIFAVFIYFQNGTGIIGTAVRSFFLGLFGIPVFVFPLILIILGVHRIIRYNYKETFPKYIYSFVIILLFSAVFQLLSGLDKSNPFTMSSIINYYDYGQFGVGGGVFGGILCDILRNATGSIVTGIILVTLILIFVMIITNWSPVKTILRMIISSYIKAKNAKERIKEEVKQQEKINEKNIAEQAEIAEKKKNEELKKQLEEIEAKPLVEVKQKKYDKDNIPAALADVDINDVKIDNLDEILINAVPLQPLQTKIKQEDTSVKEKSLNEAEKPDNEASAGNDEADKPNNAVSEEKLIEPEKLTGMIDVSDEMEEVFEKIPYDYPSVDLLNEPKNIVDNEASRKELRETAQKLIATLKSFNVEAKLLNVSKGPTVTRYELKPAEGVKVSKIVNLSDDIALRLASTGVRIEAPIPNKEAIGIEIPNKSVDMVAIKEVIDSDEFRKFSSKLAFAIGKNITGKKFVYDIGKMPHVLIAGATGSGKSVCINTLITSLIYKADPNEVKLLMVDPKVVELGAYNGIPHLLIPVVTDPRRASGALYWAVQEMMRRYAIFAENGTRDISGYNQMIENSGYENKLPHIVIIIDELADLMMVAPNEVEDSICRLAQMARAAGMHLVIATQRPSVDVITGIIKANIPSRIAFRVSSQIDSRTILDGAGAEKLVGRGDMLFYPVGYAKPVRLQGAFISDKEVERIVEFVKGQYDVKYDDDIIEKIENSDHSNVLNKKEESDSEDCDSLLNEAIELAVDTGKLSASYLQRRLKIGFSRAGRIVDQMEERGIVGPQDGSKPREVLITKEQYYEMSMKG